MCLRTFWPQRKYANVGRTRGWSTSVKPQCWKTRVLVYLWYTIPVRQALLLSIWITQCPGLSDQRTEMKRVRALKIKLIKNRFPLNSSNFLWHHSSRWSPVSCDHSRECVCVIKKPFRLFPSLSLSWSLTLNRLVSDWHVCSPCLFFPMFIHITAAIT